MSKVTLPPFPGAADAALDLGIEIDPRILKEDLEECLSTIDPLGKFAIFETLETFPNPGLVLDKGGPIGLPLSKRGAEAVIEASKQGRSGRYYSDVNRISQISKDEFRITNGAWSRFLQDVVMKVSARLGIDSTGKGVTAELEEVVLYGEDSRNNTCCQA